jgi:hypothetical protein
MKRLITVSLLLVALAVLATSSCFAANDQTLAWSMSIAGPSANQAGNSTVLDTGNMLTKFVYYSGSTTVSATSATANLVGNFLDSNSVAKVWKYEESNDGINFTPFAWLIGNSQALAQGQSNANDFSALPYMTTSQYFRISYDVTLTSAKPASASGSAALTVVPEPSSLVAIATGAVGLLGLIRRRRS